ncbi:unnamed protein product [Rhodiola kirilowii]
MTVDHTDDCYYPYKQPGSVPFKWEIRPGVPKLNHNPKPSPPTISTTRRVVSSSPQPKLKPPPAKNSSYPQEDRPIRSFRSDPRTRSALSSPRIHSERRLAGPEVVAPGCFPSPSKRVQSSRRGVESEFGFDFGPGYYSDLDTSTRWSVSSRKSKSNYSPFHYSSSDSFSSSSWSPTPVSQAEWTALGLL